MKGVLLISELTGLPLFLPFLPALPGEQWLLTEETQHELPFSSCGCSPSWNHIWEALRNYGIQAELESWSWRHFFHVSLVSMLSCSLPNTAPSLWDRTLCLPPQAQEIISSLNSQKLKWGQQGLFPSTPALQPVSFISTCININLSTNNRYISTIQKEAQNKRQILLTCLWIFIGLLFDVRDSAKY